MKTRSSRGVLTIALVGLAFNVVSVAIASSFTAPCPQDGETAQRQSEEFRQFIGGCPNGGTISSYSHNRVVSMTGKIEKHTFSLVECR